MNRSVESRVTPTSDPSGPSKERGMFAKEAYLSTDVVRAPLRPAIVRDRAFDTIFAAALEAQLAMAYRLAGYLLADPAEGQDSVQERCVRAWGACPILRDPVRFHACFNQILVNVCGTRLRQRSKH